MAQYQIGTVDVTNASAVVTGVGTLWLANVDPGDYIVILGVAGEDIHRLIQTVDSDTQLTLSAAFGGGTDTGRTYTIIRDFTTRGYPLMARLDQALQEVFNLAMTRLNSDIDTTPFTLPVNDTNAIVQDPVDNTKLVRIDAGAVGTGQTRIIFMQDANLDLAAPAVIYRRAMQEPITGDSLTGINAFDLATMAGEMLQADTSSAAFRLDLPTPGSISGWDGVLCYVRCTSANNLASITVPAPGDFTWQNGYSNPNQNATELFLGLSQNTSTGLIIPIFHRSTKYSVMGFCRELSTEDLSFQFGDADADARGGVIRNYLLDHNTETGAYTFIQGDTGGEKEFTGSSAANWTVPALLRGTNVTVHNIGTASITFVASGVTFVGNTILPAGGTAVLNWLTSAGTTVKITGETTT